MAGVPLSPYRKLVGGVLASEVTAKDSDQTHDRVLHHQQSRRHKTGPRRSGGAINGAQLPWQRLIPGRLRLSARWRDLSGIWRKRIR